MADELTEKTIGAAIEVHRVLGSGLLESVYESALCHELFLRGIAFKRQVEVSVSYKEVNVGNQRVDLLVADEVVVELKSQRAMPEAASAQVLSYLKATGLKRGLLLNFGEARLADGIKRFSL
ncbi:MAG: GxxExxY protein [Sulfuritalea sp.]|jgi:GxxExxY protein|nr:GxxExxY protein [Sulfuritalea sp.]